MGINFNANAVASPFCRRDACRAGTQEGIKNGVAYKAKHPNKSFSQFDWKGSRMILGRGSSDTSPNLLKPNPVPFGRYH